MIQNKIFVSLKYLHSASGPELEFRNLFDMDTVNQNANLLR